MLVCNTIIQKQSQIRMYYYQNPFFCHYQGQVLMLPSIVPSPFVVCDNFQKRQFHEKELVEQRKTQNCDLEVEPLLNKKAVQIQKLTRQEESEMDVDYQPEFNNKLVIYKKKNTESNISNQIYSFISCSKSMGLMLKLLKGGEQQVQQFYKLIRRIKKTNKKYINRNYISDLVELKQGGTNYKIYKRAKCSIQIEQIRKALRISVKYFLRNACISGLLTSKKMNNHTLLQHLVRRREIVDFLNKQTIEDNEN